MITTPEEWAAAKRARDTLREALDALRRDVLPLNKENFETLAAGPISEIAKLEADIALYEASNPCDPPNACMTHGRCWSHSEWEDSYPWYISTHMPIRVIVEEARKWEETGSLPCPSDVPIGKGYAECLWLSAIVALLEGREP